MTPDKQPSLNRRRRSSYKSSSDSQKYDNSPHSQHNANNRKYKFDLVFDSNSTQTEVHLMAVPLQAQHRCIFVGNIPYDTTEEQLIQICEEVGLIISFRLVIDRETGKPKGYGFCEYKDEETALSARRNLQGYEINGQQLRVDFAENEKDKNTDKSQQGRGGPGIVPGVDTHKQVGAPALQDPNLLLPLGDSFAMTAATIMAGALGSAQTAITSNQIGLQNSAQLGSDPLTRHLAKMSRSQLTAIMSEVKAWYHFSDEYPIMYEEDRLPPTVVADLNGDGKKEVLVSTHDAKIQVLEPHIRLVDEGFSEARVLTEVSLLPDNLRIATERREVAMATGFIDKNYNKKRGKDPRKQVLVVVTSGWSVMCLDHNLKKLWDVNLQVHEIPSN